MTAPFCPECGPTCPLHSTTAFLDPLHDELDRLRTEVEALRHRLKGANAEAERCLRAQEQAEARVDQLTDQLNLANDTLRHRGNAVNATGHTNDQLRATIARIEKYANDIGANTAATGYARGQREACSALRAILADQETK